MTTLENTPANYHYLQTYTRFLKCKDFSSINNDKCVNYSKIIQADTHTLTQTHLNTKILFFRVESGLLLRYNAAHLLSQYSQIGKEFSPGLGFLCPLDKYNINW